MLNDTTKNGFTQAMLKRLKIFKELKRAAAQNNYQTITAFLKVPMTRHIRQIGK
jgi:hypothetical protein